MPLGAHCNHCDEDRAVVPMQDYENDRFIYACTFCGWWGLDPLRIEFSSNAVHAKARRDVEP